MIVPVSRYNRKGLGLRGQFYYSSLANTSQYNVFTAEESIPNDLGSSMYGYYIEAAYNVFYPFEKIKNELIPFVRYSVYDTHASVDSSIAKNEAFHKTIITTGLGFWFVPQVAVKTEIQFIRSAASSNFSKTFNAGIAVMF